METVEKEIKISVRSIIELIVRSGDIESGFLGSNRAVEGTRAHQKVQHKRDKEMYKYKSELVLSHSVDCDGFILTISGRADGIIVNDDKIIVEEIKSTNKELDNIDEDYNSLHWAQVMLYAYFYALDNRMDSIGVQLTYFQLETEKIKEFKRSYLQSELKDFFDEIISKYFYWADFSHRWLEERNDTVKKLDFPFPSYRKGQRQLAVSVYKTIKDKCKIFIQAPTGIGKTISTVFPAIKALENNDEKIFYLTAKTVTRQVVEENISLLHNKGLKIKSITLTAKDKICFQEETECNPELCSYARGHYDRINNALKAVLEEENLITREKVETYAKVYQVCPFEFSLDLTMWVDIVVCDYNYVFDPRVGLKRFFSDDGGNYTFLIDEAHNLVDRAREMYSAELLLNDFIVLKDLLIENKNCINKGFKDKEFYKVLSYINKIINLMQGYKDKLVREDCFVQKEEPLEYQPLLNGFIDRTEELIILNQKNKLVKGSYKNKSNDSQKQKSEGNLNYGDNIQEPNIIDLLLQQYFNVLAFNRMIEIYDENFIVYYQYEKNDNSSTYHKNISNDLDKNKFKVKIFCLDPHLQLKQVLEKGKAAAFFSATMTPLTYHRQILGGNDTDYMLDLMSPFDSNNLCLLVAPGISTKYSKRGQYYTSIAEYIDATIKGKEGNYLIFFSSYAYMSDVYKEFIQEYSHYRTIIQSRNMSEKERRLYLDNFNSTDSVIAFAVLGGVFSEGVDLKGDKLLGTIVIGVAHPRICLERNLIRDFFQDKNGMGYEFAYLYPGINKVLQAAGRTIRTETDRGLILLVGERFSTYRYQNMLPGWWNKIKKTVIDKEDIKKELSQFWI